MTHTLHRRGSVSELQHEYVVLAMAAKGINRDGSAPNLARILEIFSRHHPVIYGNVAGNSCKSDIQYMLDNTKDNTVAHAVFHSEADLAGVLAELKDKDLGVSIVVSGLFDKVGTCCREVGLKPHTVNVSLGIWGKKSKLPSEEILQIETMCGHNMISVALIEAKLKKIKSGALTPEVAAKQLARNCHCGIFNWERAMLIFNKILQIDQTQRRGIIMKTAHQKRLDFRARLKSKKIMITPGIYDALSAKIAQEAGIPCLAMGGYAIEASRLAQPDVGLLSLAEMTGALKQICDATDIPVIGDGDTGYGNALNAIRTEREFEAAGAACVFLEDQVWPKRCGHMDGKQVITAEEHAQKIRAAADARVDKDMMIMARTDTRAINGLEDAIERGKRYADAGAEIIFIEALRDRAEIEKAARAFDGTGIYLTSNMIEGGKTPLIPAKELEQMGYSVVFWACSSLYLVSKTLHEAFSTLNTTGTTTSLADKMIDFTQFNHFIGLDTYKKLEREYKVDRKD